MNLSMKWLSEFTPADMPVKAFADAMTMSGSKVEGFEAEGAKIENIVVGKILSIESIPTRISWLSARSMLEKTPPCKL